jgi:hypothetical protein
MELALISHSPTLRRPSSIRTFAENWPAILCSAIKILGPAQEPLRFYPVIAEVRERSYGTYSPVPVR